MNCVGIPSPPGLLKLSPRSRPQGCSYPIQNQNRANNPGITSNGTILSGLLNHGSIACGDVLLWRPQSKLSFSGKETASIPRNYHNDYSSKGDDSILYRGQLKPTTLIPRPGLPGARARPSGKRMKHSTFSCAPSVHVQGIIDLGPEV